MALTKIRGFQIQSGTVDTTQIKDSAVNASKIADNAVTTTKINDSAVTTNKILNANVTTAKIADDAVTLAKMAGLGQGKLITGDADDNPVALNLGGANQVLKSNGTSLVYGAVQTADIANDAVTLEKMASLNQGNIIIGDVSNNPSALAAGSANHVLVSNGTTASYALVGTDNIDGLAVTSAKLANSLNLTGKTVTVDTPSSASEVANKSYVDAAIEGLDVKESVVAATTARITVASTADNTSTVLTLADGEGGFDAASDSFTVDGVSLSADDRVLIKNGINDGSSDIDSVNGIYTVGALNGSKLTLTRSDDFDDVTTNITSGAFTFVEQGTANQNSGFVMTQDAAITLGTTAITWIQFSGAGSSTASNGVKKSGSDFSLNIAIATNFNNGSFTKSTQEISSVNYDFIGTFYDALLANGTSLSINVQSGFVQVFLNGILQEVLVESGTGNIANLNGASPSADALFDTSAGRLYFANGTLTNNEDLVTIYFGN